MEITKVSVIIPAYNRRHLIARAINSVLNQKYKNYEIIVIDDGSKDRTAEFISKKYKKINLIRLDKNSGAAAARNAGIKLAKGEYLAFLDSDDEWPENYLEVRVKALEENTKVALSYCDCINISKGSAVNIISMPKFANDLIKSILFRNFIWTMSIIVVKKEVLLKAGLLNENLKICHDGELYIRLLRLGQLLHVPNLAVKRYVHDKNLTNDYAELTKDKLRTVDFALSQKENSQWLHLKKEAQEFIEEKARKDILYRSKLANVGRGIKIRRIIGSAIEAHRYSGSFFWKRVIEIKDTLRKLVKTRA